MASSRIHANLAVTEIREPHVLHKMAATSLSLPFRIRHRAWRDRAARRVLHAREANGCQDWLWERLEGEPIGADCRREWWFTPSPRNGPKGLGVAFPKCETTKDGPQERNNGPRSWNVVKIRTSQALPRQSTNEFRYQMVHPASFLWGRPWPAEALANSPGRPRPLRQDIFG